MADYKNSRWIIEYFTDYEAHMHGIKKYFCIEQTPYQVVEIAETYDYGKCLFLDGKIQSSQLDEYIYHELLVHPALITHPNPKKVFIVGGGEGAAVREILKHNTVKEVIMVDIDEKVVRLCEKYLPEWNNGAFKDKKTKLVFTDARKYLRDSKDKFDCIIIDITEPVEDGPSYLLFTKEFYKIVNNRLTDDGIISLQAGSTTIKDNLCHAAIYKTLKKVFPVVKTFEAMIPSFDTPWGFAMASKKYDPEKIIKTEIDNKLKARGINDLKHYDGILHSGLFILPKDLRRTYNDKRIPIIEDGKPIFTPV